MILCELKTNDLSVLDELDNCVQKCWCCEECKLNGYIYLELHPLTFSLVAHVDYPSNTDLVFDDKQKFINYCRAINAILNHAKSSNASYIDEIKILRKDIELM